MLAEINTFLFDLDGTLTVPVLDFAAIRHSLGLPAGVSIVHALAEMPSDLRAEKEALLRRHELDAAAAAKPSPGAIELVMAIQVRGCGVAVITRNFDQAVQVTLDALGLHVEVVITRDDAPPKPAPDGLLLALDRLHALPARSIMVGDYQDDMLAGKAAGIRTALVTHGSPPRFEADLYIESPAELLARLHQAWK
ncbi:MAG: HAD family hydrolase [Planctomycetes bacterium]|nr:HAD family hydrolase [Planctomycetota bacterium]